jgi:uncharacterized protein YbjT (DUF2867 family)
MSLTAVIIGATGLVGSALLEKLLSHKDIDKVVAVSRRPLNVNSPKLDNLVIDFSAVDSIADKIHGDVFFSCLGTTKKQAGSIAAQRIVDFDYQLASARIAAANGIPHYCLVSSSAANSNSLSPYLKMKGELEDQIKDLNFERITILQPSLLLGQRHEQRTGESIGTLFLPWLCRLPGLRRYRPIQGEEVATKLLQQALRPAAMAAKIDTLALDNVFPQKDQ